MESLLSAFESTQRRWLVGSLSLAVVILAASGAGVMFAGSSTLGDAQPPTVAEPVQSKPATNAEPLPAGGPIELLVGSTRRLWIPGLSSVSVGEAGIADVKVADENILEVTGLAVVKTPIIVTSGPETRRWEVEVAPALSSSSLALKVGQQRMLDERGVERLAVGDPTVADVVKVVEKTQLMVLGVKPGKTTIVVWKALGTREQIDVDVSK